MTVAECNLAAFIKAGAQPVLGYLPRWAAFHEVAQVAQYLATGRDTYEENACVLGVATLTIAVGLNKIALNQIETAVIFAS